MSATAYQGVWHNHGSDRLILTLTTDSGYYVMIILAIWVQFVGVATWPIVRFGIWSAGRKRDNKHDTFHDQRQVLVRNSSSAGTVTWQITRLIWSWKGRKGNSMRKGIPHALLTVLVAVSWVICGLFVPYTTTHTDDNFLIVTEDRCGTLTRLEGHWDIVLPYFMRRISEAQIYAQKYYTSGSEKRLPPSTYPAPVLPFTTVIGSSYPCTDISICSATNASAIQLDTQLLNSNDHFGINAPAADQVEYQRSMTCSPIDLRPFTISYDASELGDFTSYRPGSTYTFVDLGPGLGTDFTYMLTDYQQSYQNAYDVVVWSYFPRLISNQWTPSRALFDSSSADASVVFILPGGVDYPAPVEDPIFAAGLTSAEVKAVENDDGTTFNRYIPHDNITAIFCTEQHSICAAGSPGRCTLPGPAEDLYEASLWLTDPISGEPALNSKQMAAVYRMRFGMDESILYSALAGRGSASLKASRTLRLHQQTAVLPKDHWQREVTEWFATGLTLMQDSVFTFAAGRGDPALWPAVELPSDDGNVIATCDMQRGAGLKDYQNLDFVAVIIILVMGTVLGLIGFCFDTVIGKMAKRGWFRYVYQEWEADGVLEMHRIAAEVKHGVGEWIGVGDAEDSKSSQKIWPATGTVEVTVTDTEPESVPLAEHHAVTASVMSNHVDSGMRMPHEVTTSQVSPSDHCEPFSGSTTRIPRKAAPPKLLV